MGATAQFDMTDPDYPQGVIDLNVRYDLGSDPSAEDLVGRWGAPGDGNDGSISFPIVPEPTAHLMVVTALAALSLSRRRR